MLTDKTEDAPLTTIAPRCPICGCPDFVTFRGRKAECCAACGAHVRTRSAWLILTEVCKIGPETRLLHFAPEPALAPRLRALCGVSYAPCDLNNKRYKFGFPVAQCNLCTDTERLFEPGSFDVVLHNHVLEHLPCNYTIVLQRLHALLRPGGHHVFSFPIGSTGHYRSNMSPELPLRDRRRQFGQKDHIRRFTRNDFDQTVGMVFGLTRDYRLSDHIPAETLLGAGIPEQRWSIETGTVFVVQKT